MTTLRILPGPRPAQVIHLRPAAPEPVEVDTVEELLAAVYATPERADVIPIRRRSTSHQIRQHIAEETRRGARRMVLT